MIKYSPLMTLASLFFSLYSLSTTNITVANQTEPDPPEVYLPIMLFPCWPNSLPIGAIPGQPLPVFCSIQNQGPDTSQSGNNSWSDQFNHHLEFADFSGAHYKVFETVGFVNKTLHWRHADHWMVDVSTNTRGNPPRWVRGGGLMRPDRTFRFEDGRLVVEAEVAAGIEKYEGNAWPELVISTGASPLDTGSLYAYDLFPEDWTLGCRLQASRYPVCALKSNQGDIQNMRSSSRIWEMSAHQPVGKTNFGGSPFEGREKFWKVCKDTDPDMDCRDLFRLELTRTSVTLFVNGNKYFEQLGVPPLPDALFSGNLYVYFASVAVSHPAEALRFHWDQLAINPGLLPSLQTRADPQNLYQSIP